MKRRTQSPPPAVPSPPRLLCPAAILGALLLAAGFAGAQPPPLVRCVDNAPRQPFPAGNLVCSEPVETLVDEGDLCDTSASRTVTTGTTVTLNFQVGGSFPWKITDDFTITPSFTASYAIATADSVALTIPGCAHTKWVARANGCKWVTCASDDLDDYHGVPFVPPGVECSDNPIYAGCPGAATLNAKCSFAAGGQQRWAVKAQSCQYAQYGAVGGVSSRDARQKFSFYAYHPACECAAPVPGCPNQCPEDSCPNPLAPMYCAAPGSSLVKAQWSPEGRAKVSWTDNLHDSDKTRDRVQVSYTSNPSPGTTRTGYDRTTDSCGDGSQNAFQQRTQLDRYRSWDIAVRYKCPPPATGVSAPVFTQLPGLPRPKARCRNCRGGGVGPQGEGEETCSCALAQPGEPGFDNCEEAPLCPEDCNYDGVCDAGERAGGCDDCRFASSYQCRCESSGSCVTTGPTCRELEDGETDFSAAASCVDADNRALLPFCCGDGFCAPEGGEDPRNCRRDCGMLEVPPPPPDPGCQSNWDCYPGQACCQEFPAQWPYPFGSCLDLIPGELPCGGQESVLAESYCGDRSCDLAAGEGADSCPEDCGEPPPGFACGDGLCDAASGENEESCERDCTAPGGDCVPACSGVACGEDNGCGGTCQPGSGCALCSVSCTGLPCGSQSCGQPCLDGSGCYPAHCLGASCGDGRCDADCFENASNCFADCRPCAPATCASLGLYCGGASDGCGGSLSCGACGANQECSAGQCRTCTTQLSPSLLNAPSSGLAGAQVGVASACSWTIGALPAWASVAGQQSGAAGYLRLDVAPSSQGSPRSAQIAVGNQTLRIEQAACSAATSLQTTSLAVGKTGITGHRVKVYVAGPCAWQAASNVSWITITSGSSGLGNGEVVFNVASTTTNRTGTLTIAGLTFTVNQTK